MLSVRQLVVLVGADVDERGDVAVVRAANKDGLPLAPLKDHTQPPFWGRSLLLFQGDDVFVAREAARQAQRQVVRFGAAVQRGQRLLRVTESPQNTQLMGARRSWRPRLRRRQLT